MKAVIISLGAHFRGWLDRSRGVLAYNCVRALSDLQKAVNT